MLSGHRVSICAVAGMGGVGKTELATQYARTHEADYPGGICWLNARDTNLAAEIIQFAQLYMNLEVPQELGGRQLNFEEQVAWCWQRWQPPEGQVLVVLDDVTDLRSCRKVLPRANRFRVLMTTRLRRIDTNFVEISLDVFSPEAALELLTALLGEQDRRVQQERETAECLCRRLGYLPLGLELVGRYLAEDLDLSLADMLERLKAQKLEDEAIAPSEEQLQNTISTTQRGVRAAFELSWQGLDPVTQRVAQYLSLFAPTVFLWNWVESATELFNCPESEINAAKKQLYKRYLIGRVEEREGGYKIHPLIREFLQAKLVTSEQADEFRQGFAVVFVEIAKAIPESPTLKDIELVKDAIPHLEEVTQNLTDVLKDSDLAWSFVGSGRFYEAQGLYALAEPSYQKCLEVTRYVWGEDHEYFAAHLNNLAALYSKQGRYSEAEPLYVQALKLHKSSLGEDHPHSAITLNNLAIIYYEQGRYSEAEPLYLQALALTKKLLGNYHPRVAITLNNLSRLYSSQGRYSEAEPLIEQALALTKKLLGNDHTHVAIMLNNLGLNYYEQGRYCEAEPLIEQALALTKKLLGNYHPHVATTLSSLAGIYYYQGRYSEAEPLYVKALELSKQVLENNHPSIATMLNNLAFIYDSQERYGEAESLYVQALELIKRLLGNEHPFVAMAVNNLAGLYSSQGRYSEAEPLYLQALELSKRVFGVNHPHTVNFRNGVAIIRAKIASITVTQEVKSAIKANKTVKQATGFGSEHTFNLTAPVKKAKDKRNRKRRN